MLSFTNPAALLALTGLLVPLAIHLWNRRPGRVVPVGALRWLTAGANRRMRQLHLTQWPLLLLRLLLLLVLVALLAGPRWAFPPPPGRPQVLVSPAVLASPAWPLLRPQVDSLRRRGAELRAFSPGFPLLTDSLAQQAAARSARTAARAADWYWPQAVAAADSFPGQPLYLFIAPDLAHFRGSRPALPARLHWQLVPLDSTSSTWLQAAARPTPDSLRLLLGRGDAARIAFRRLALAWPGDAAAPLRVPGLPPLELMQQGPGRATFQLAGDSAQAPVPVSYPLRVAIVYEASRREDLRYVQAALRAGAAALPAGLQLRAVPWPGAAARLRPDSLDWLLWLADAPLPAAVPAQLPRGLQVLRDAPGPGQEVNTTFSAPDADVGSPGLYRRAAAPQAATALWTDATGQPVLTRTWRGHGASYQLLTRFHPQWSSLPDDGRLPELLLSLLLPESAFTGPDPRALPTAQLRNRLSHTSSLRARPRYLDLGPWLALGAGLLFGVERLLAARRSSPTA